MKKKVLREKIEEIFWKVKRSGFDVSEGIKEIESLISAQTEEKESVQMKTVNKSLEQINAEQAERIRGLEELCKHLRKAKEQAVKSRNLIIDDSRNMLAEKDKIIHNSTFSRQLKVETEMVGYRDFKEQYNKAMTQIKSLTAELEKERSVKKDYYKDKKELIKLDKAFQLVCSELDRYKARFSLGKEE